MKFSIIIPVRKINDFLVENISHLRRLDYKDFEVIIVLDKKEKFNFGGDKRFKIIASGKRSPGEKRNIGVKESSGNVVVFLDDDAYPSKRWLREAEKIFNRKGIYALGAPAVTPKNATFLEKMGGRVLESMLVSGNTVFRHVPQGARKIDDYPSVNLFVKKEVFNKVGGFTKEFWPGEDTKLCLDMVEEMNRKFDYDPRPVVFHHRRELFLPHLKQVSRYGKHRGQFARIFPETSRRFSYFVPSVFVFGLLFGWAVSVKVYICVVITYLVLVFVEAFRAFFKERKIISLGSAFLGIISTHLVYGINFIIGFMKKPELKLRRIDKVTGNYIEG
ncbi:glycosyltransferase [Patescibacteria group bacterium]